MLIVAMMQVSIDNDELLLSYCDVDEGMLLVAMWVSIDNDEL